MSWYNAGTVSVNQGSDVVDGAGCNFLPPNVLIGFGFVDEAGLLYQVVAIDSATRLRIKPAYRSASGGGRSYQILPTQEFMNALALRAQAMIDKYDGVLDGVGRGLFADGSPAAPGMRFTADQDTGIRRNGNDSLAIVAGGVDRMIIASDRVQVVTPVTISGNQPVRMEASQGGAGAFGRFEWFNSAGFSSQARAFIEGRRDADADNGYLDFAVADFTNIPPTVKATLTPVGNFGVGTRSPQVRAHVAAGDQSIARLRVQNTGTGGQSFDLVAGINSVGQAGFSIFDATNGMTRMTIDASGNLLVGVTSHPFHRIVKQVNPGAAIFTIDNAFASSVFFFGTDRNSFSDVMSAMQVGVVSATGRSINAGGTINASGADYAEYISKSDGCGAIAKGDVCGIDRHGLLTKLWSTAVRFVVKSTDPNLVGGDSWGRHLGPRPNGPIYATPVYDGPAEPVRPEAPAPYTAPEIALPARPIRGEGESDDDFTDRVAAYLVERGAALAAIEQAGEAEAAWSAAQVRYTATLRQYEVDSVAYDAARRAFDDVEAAAGAAHDEAVKAHAVTLAKWEADLEAARQTVDRIAFSGQVPVNVDADTLAACEAALADGVAVYLVAIARGAGIGVTAVREGDMTLVQYMRRVGCVWAIRDGRPWVDVQHG